MPHAWDERVFPGVFFRHGDDPDAVNERACAFNGHSTIRPALNRDQGRDEPRADAQSDLVVGEDAAFGNRIVGVNPLHVPLAVFGRVGVRFDAIAHA